MRGRHRRRGIFDTGPDPGLVWAVVCMVIGVIGLAVILIDPWTN